MTRGARAPPSRAIVVEVGARGDHAAELGAEHDGRFALLRLLGAGAFGQVFLAKDRVRDTEVALKRLGRAEPHALHRFKREFRTVASLAHPNLVRLHELFSTETCWFFTMDYVPGEPVSRHVAAAPESRLRPALRQLAEALAALHDAGVVHRDLKPANVLATPAGQVVVLDFGLAAPPEHGRHGSVDARMQGTPGYMAPEQAFGGPITPATDWFAFGALLFECLTGHPPFGGGLEDVLAALRLGAAPDPRLLRPDLPAELSTLCVALLKREPAARPGRDEVLARLGAPAPAPFSTRDGREVERGVERAALLEAFDAATTRGPVVVLLSGSAGAGKSALLDGFLHEARARRGALTLKGRCYEREHLPYKALDELIDELAQHLRHLPTGETSSLWPREGDALALVFPALRRVELLAAQPERDGEEDPRELRRRACAALRELLTGLTDRGPLVLAIDDAQWSCADSVELLTEVLEPPGAPRVLLIVGYRREEQERCPVLRALRERLSGVAAEVRALAL